MPAPALELVAGAEDEVVEPEPEPELAVLEPEPEPLELVGVDWGVIV